MAAALLRLTQLPAPTGALTTIYAVPVGKKANLDLRACNNAGSVLNGAIDVYLKDTVTPANSGYRARTYPIPYSQSGSAPDLEYGLILPAGFELQVQADLPNAVGLSLSGVVADLTDDILTPVNKVLGTGLTSLFTSPADTMCKVSVRYCNITVAPAGADATADLYLVDTLNGGNSGYRCRTFPVPYAHSGSAPDIEYELPVPAGFTLQGRASATNAVAASVTGVKADA